MLPACDEALAQRRGRRQLRLLLDQHDAQAVLARDLAVVERDPARDDLQQRRLAGAVAADQADALAVVDREVGAVEQRVQAVGELGVAQGDQGHGANDSGVRLKPDLQR